MFQNKLIDIKIMSIKSKGEKEFMKKGLMAKILSALMIVCFIIVNVGIQSIVAKADTSTTYSSLVNGIVWQYQVDTAGNAVNVGPLDRYNYKQFGGDNIKVVIPDTLNGKKVTSICENAFFECIKVTSITIPQGVTSIGKSAFSACASLTNITIPAGVTRIEDNTFESCWNLLSITMPEGITSIGDNAFYECFSLGSIAIPKGLTSIGNSSFMSCESLTSVSIPEGVTNINSKAFSGCTSLNTLNIPDSVKNISSDAFEGCTSLTTIYANSGSAASTYNWENGKVDTRIGYISEQLIKDTKTNAKNSIVDANKALSDYIAVGGLATDAVYQNLKSLIDIYSTNESIEAETDIPKLINWISELDTKITAINAETQKKVLTISTFTSNLSSPQVAGTAITLSTTATGGIGTLQTKFTVNDGTTTTTIKDYSTVATATWTPSQSGTYTLTTYVKDANGKEVTKTLTYVVKEIPVPAIDSFTTSVASPQYVGTGITLNASSSGGTGTLQTKFTVNDGTTTTTLKDYSTVATATWTPSRSGTYTITVYVKDVNGKEVTKTLTYVVKELPTPSIDSFTTSIASPQYVGTGITLNASSSGGTGTLQTKFTVNDGTTTTTLKDYSTVATATWTPSKSGTYTLTAYVKDTNGKEVTKTLSYVISKNQTTIYYKGYTKPYIHYKIGNGNWTTAPGVAMIPTIEMVGYTNKITIDLGTATTLTACFNNGSGTWDNNKGADYTFNVGTYLVSGGTVTKLQDKTTPSIDSFTTSALSPQNVGTAITLNATSSGGTGTLQTKFTVNDGTTTTILKDYSTVSTATWTPSKSGTYTLTAYVKDSNGTEVTKTLSYVVKDIVVTPTINSFTTSVVSPQNIGTAITLSATSSGGTGTLQTKFTVNDGTTTTTLKDYSTVATATWTPTKAGTYTLTAYVKDANGVEVSKTTTYVINNPITKNLTTIYYSGYTTSYIHYKIGSGSWTTAPGVVMIPTTEMAGYTNKITIDLGTATTLTACFNNGSGTWDNNKGSDYTFNVGTYGVSGGIITKLQDQLTPSIDSFTTSVASPQNVGTAITLNAKSSGGTGTLQTKFTVNDGTTTTTLKDYSTVTTATWTPAKSGTYTLTAYVKDSNGVEVTKTLSYVVKDIVVTPTINSFTTSIASPQLTGTAITLSATSSGGTGTLQTKFTVNDGTTTTTLKDYSTVTTATWTPAAAGTYTLTAYVKDANGVEVTKTITYVINNPITKNLTTIYYKGYATPYIHYKVGTGNWTTAPGVAMTPTTEMVGYTHKITIDLGTATSLIACFNNGSGTWDSNNGANYTFNAGTYQYSGGVITKIADPVKTFGIDSFTTNVLSPQNVGTAITLSAATSNGTGTVQTKFTVNNGTTTTILKDYSTVTTATWTPTTAGTYTLTAYVKDANGVEVTKTITYVINNPITKNLTTIYYKGYTTPYIHYKIGTGNWTTAPGVAMTPTTEMSGYTHKITIDLGTATTLTACFNNGSGTWDSNNGANYTFNVGTYTYSNGSIVLIK